VLTFIYRYNCSQWYWRYPFLIIVVLFGLALTGKKNREHQEALAILNNTLSQLKPNLKAISGKLVKRDTLAKHADYHHYLLELTDLINRYSVTPPQFKAPDMISSSVQNHQFSVTAVIKYSQYFDFLAKLKQFYPKVYIQQMVVNNHGLNTFKIALKFSQIFV
jgi:hypothetical protein